MCGLRPMLSLAEMKALAPNEAWKIAQAISLNNMYITNAILDDFKRELNRIVAAKTMEVDRRSRKRPDDSKR